MISIALNVGATQENYIKNTLLPPIQRYLEEALKVIPLSRKLAKKTYVNACDSSVVEKVFDNDNGIDADLIIFVSSINETSANYVASAKACILSPEDFRYA